MEATPTLPYLNQSLYEALDAWEAEEFENPDIQLGASKPPKPKKPDGRTCEITGKLCVATGCLQLNKCKGQ